MAMKGMGGENRVSPRKSIGMGMTGMGDEKFGVKPGLYSANMKNPDAKMGHDALEDGNRGMAPAVKHSGDMHPAQAMPSHGPMRVRE